jgi:hypothetical protein
VDRDFFERKIKELTDDKLIELLQKVSDESNREILELARQEAAYRRLGFKIAEPASLEETDNNFNEKLILKKWNWGAFILSPIWTLANKLENWTILLFVPFVNIFVIIYLGLNGNKLAYAKSKSVSVHDFMLIQRYWARWAIRIFWLGIAAGVVALIVDAVNDIK